MSAAIPTLTQMLAAVREALPTVATVSDVDVIENIRTARTTKGAVWLATRAFGTGADDAKAAGRVATALACLQALAAADNPHALAALSAWAASEVDAGPVRPAALLDA